MANSNELHEALKHSKWGEVLDDLVREENHSAKNEAIDLGVFEEASELIDLNGEPVVTYLRSQCESEHPYMVAAVGVATGGITLKISSEFLLHHSEVMVPYITGEQRSFLWEHSEVNQPHIYIFTHANGKANFILGEMKELASRAVSTKRDVYFVLVGAYSTIGMKYDYSRKEFFEVEVLSNLDG